MPVISAGLPGRNEYETIIRGDEFRRMESLSDRFLAANRAALKDYMRR